MDSAIIDNILKRINRPELLSVLADELTGSELNSLLLEVFRHKTACLTPPELLNLYQQNRFVKPADLPVLEMRQTELDILKLFDQHGFNPLELSPVSILGACSVLGPVNQKKVLTALRGTEVLADSTNAIALHASHLKQKNQTRDDSLGVWMRCSTIQRQLRTQTITGPGFTPHFKIGCLVTCGNDVGGYDFEKNSLLEHIRTMKALFLDYYKADNISFRLLPRGGYKDSEHLLEELNRFFQNNAPGTKLSIVKEALNENNYYKGIQYKVDITIKGGTYEIADGGFVDWTQHLLQNKKERMLSTGFGFDLMFRIQKGSL